MERQPLRRLPKSATSSIDTLKMKMESVGEAQQYRAVDV
jgi:hypothetical protein